MEGEMITKAELSRRLGISKARVSQLVARGLPVNEDGSITYEEAVKWLNAHSSTKSKVLSAARAAKPKENSGLSDHWAFLADIKDPAQRTTVKGVMMLAYQVPAITCLTMIDAGVPVATARAMFYQLAMVAMEQAAEILEQCEPFSNQEDPPVWDTDAFWQVNWEGEAK